MNTENDSMAPDSVDPEDQAILEALDAFAMGAMDEGSTAGSADEALRRLYVEVLGLLPASLDPVVPDDRVWQRLAADMGGQPVAERAPAALSAPIAPDATPSDPPATPRATTIPFASAGPSLSRTAMRRHSRWPLALAATLAFALAGLSLYLLRNLDEQSDLVASLYVKLAASERQTADARLTQGKLAEIKEKYSLVTNPGVSINRLASTGEQIPSNASGILFVAADHHHWVLCLEGLPPADAGKGYQLWFMGESAAVSGGTFTAHPGEMVELSAESMPAGTKAILITLEPAAGSPLPSGPRVLATVG